ncbi:levanase [Abditibacteriota bacterium]|nr:levanase [Abditibacteriota bacterium]
MKFKRTLFAAFGLFIVASPSACFARDDIVVADFEGPTYGDWVVTGTAFGNGPTPGSLGGQMAVTGFMGKGLVNSYKGGDEATGTLSSLPFTIERKYLNFLIGGGKNAGQLALRLLVDGKVVRSATGPNDRPGGSEKLDWSSWDVSEYAGKKAAVTIVDEATGGWGHISVDNITQSDTMKATLPGEREITVTEPLLLLPIKNGGAKRVVTVSVGGKELRHFDIELADGIPDWWATLDLNLWKGQKITVKTNALPSDSQALAQITQGQTLPDTATLYKEPLRGQFHFSSKVGWLNDPNGMVYSQGEYHLFYQHNPYGWAWGNMHWGHAVSPDMVHWTELPVAIYPHAPGDDVFSGSAVVDKGNTAGWKKGANDVLVAAFTSTGRGECIAYSNDKGRTWTEYEGNPVVKHKVDGRDPRLLWHEPTHQWVMVVWDVDNSQPIPDDRGGINFYTSPDLKTWTYQSHVGGYFECPDLFELPTEDGQKKWVLTAASTDYRIGTFDGKKFVPETPRLVGQQGRDYYAAQTFSNSPDGRRVQIAWFRTETPGMPFNQSMSLPSELKIKNMAEGPRLTWTPVTELQSLRTQTHSLGALSLSEGNPNPLAALSGELVEIRADFEPRTANEVTFNVRGVPVVYNATRGELRVGTERASAPLQNGKQQLTIYLDRTGIEVYASDGSAFVPLPVNVKVDEHTLAVSAKGGTAKFSRLDVYELSSSWNTGTRQNPTGDFTSR